MLILLYSDTNYVLDGFKAEFSTTNCPNNCTNQGKCVNHRCVCHGDWVGADCSQDPCPDKCGYDENKGHCSQDQCNCKPVSEQNCLFIKYILYKIYCIFRIIQASRVACISWIHQAMNGIF